MEDSALVVTTRIVSTRTVEVTIKQKTPEPEVWVKAHMWSEGWGRFSDDASSRFGSNGKATLFLHCVSEEHLRIGEYHVSAVEVDGQKGQGETTFNVDSSTLARLSVFA